MATNEIIAKLNELAELRRIAEYLNAEIEAIENIKANIKEAAYNKPASLILSDFRDGNRSAHLSPGTITTLKASRLSATLNASSHCSSENTCETTPFVGALPLIMFSMVVSKQNGLS